MHKAIAIANVIAWSGFWAFGYLALTAGTNQPGQMVTAAILAGLGGAVGLLAFLWLARHAEATGYAKPANRAEKRDDDEIHGEVL
ncbi:hypothetical protein RAZWK3B_04210 [Roseobacter sp. AzwK-3b]|uniref:hypothetical protein n=1 Tax=Roseobacter sp. AzwK-3b TaxID=351016 RepID=UPI0001569A8D|nr:hypothetical protein [Roseobacter sp. AzwK-3b]EDM73396.1 hypothetical protein RAZWK3B_04210 [Roseobacter sp. AzwK-3b]